MTLRRTAPLCSLALAFAPAVALILALLGASPVRAAEPALPDNPGWYRAQIGTVTVTALFDGTTDMPVDEVFKYPGPTRLKQLLVRARVPMKMPMSVNAFVVDTGSHVVMIDTGTGTSQAFGAGLGRVQAHLRAAGYRPEQIEAIYLTHMHTDHLGGLTVDGHAVFPNAVVRAEAREAGYFLDRRKMAALPEEEREDFATAIAMLEPYVASGRFRPFEGRTDLMPGIRAEPAWGHTPGHTAYVVESAGEKLVLWGDSMHVAAVQFPLPAASVTFDADGRDAAANRERLFRLVARDGAWVGAAHVGFPGIGKLGAASGGGYTWVPISMVRGR